MRTLLVFLYRLVMKLVWAPLDLSRSLNSLSKKRDVHKKAIWFHAASAGELEVLMPVIELTLNNGNSVWVTLFSSSNEILIDKLNARYGKVFVNWLGAALSPMEGSWKKSLSHFVPDVFVTAKYEAWPELWISLAELNVPLWIVGAKVRSSIKTAKNICSLVAGKSPRIVFNAFNEKEKVGLENYFQTNNGCKFLQTADPRWDRIASRASQKGERVQYLLSTFASLPKPWGCLAQVWSSDLHLFENEFIKNFKGTLFIVPHSLEEASVSELLRRMEALTSKKAVRTAQLKNINPNSLVVVDEFGVLLELYQSMDWAYVGGGFEKGIHSTMEPAFFALPVACGPMKHENFSEVTFLKESGQLALVHTSNEFQAWLSEKRLGIPQEMKLNWNARIQKQLGGSKVIFQGLVNE